MKKKIIKIAFDVASNKTGYAVIIDKKVFESGVIDLSDYNKQTETTKKKMTHIYLFISSLVWKISKTVNGENQNDKKQDLKFFIVFEHNTHGNQTVANKLNFYAGAYSQAIISVMILAFPHNIRNATFKFVSAQEWQARIQSKNKHFSGDYTKEHSLKIANALMKKTFATDKLITSDDEAEALIMAHFSQELRDIETARDDKKTRFKNIKQVRARIQRKEGFVAKYKISGETKKYEKHNKDLEILKKELKQLMSYSLFD